MTHNIPAKYRRSMFFTRESENCTTLDTIVDEMRYLHSTKCEVTLAKRTPNQDYMYCRLYQEVGEKGNCGKFCNGYKPRNGKSGACVSLGSLYEPTDQVFTVTLREDEFTTEF